MVAAPSTACHGRAAATALRRQIQCVRFGIRAAPLPPFFSRVYDLAHSQRTNSAAFQRGGWISNATRSWSNRACAFQ
jgi:hypothetical protein